MTATTAIPFNLDSIVFPRRRREQSAHPLEQSLSGVREASSAGDRQLLLKTLERRQAGGLNTTQ